MEFLKIFDRVNIELLFCKLQRYRLKDTVMAWLHSYLTDRTSRLITNDWISNPVSVCSGVPQGSHFAPLLFLICTINIRSNSFSVCRRPLRGVLDIYRFLKTFSMEFISNCLFACCKHMLYRLDCKVVVQVALLVW